MIAAVSAWRLPKLTFKCAIESRFRFVSDVGGDFSDTSRCPFERSRGQLKPPAGQICHRWLGEISRKALHESGPRDAYLVREIRDRPGMGNAAVEQGEAFSYDGIARSREPPHLLLRQPANVAPQRVNEQRLRELG